MKISLGIAKLASFGFFAFTLGGTQAQAAMVTHPNKPLRSNDLKVEVCKALRNEMPLLDSIDDETPNSECLNYRYVVTRQVTSQSVVKMATLLDIEVRNFNHRDCSITLLRVPGQIRVDVDGDLTQDADRWAPQKILCE
jgi:hypothetical protein